MKGFFSTNLINESVPKNGFRRVSLAMLYCKIELVISDTAPNVYSQLQDFDMYICSIMIAMGVHNCFFTQII